MKKIHQFKITKDTELSKEKNILEISNTVIYSPVSQVGIFAPEKTKFSFDGGSDGHWIEIGKYNIYELDLSNGLGAITSIYIDTSEIEDIDYSILVDIVYEEVMVK